MGLEHVSRNEDAAHALDPEVLDEAHATHVGSQVVDLRGALAGAFAVVGLAQVQAQAITIRSSVWASVVTMSFTVCSGLGWVFLGHRF